MSGAPGSGKSTVARLLRSSIGGINLDHDVLRSTIHESALVSFDQAVKQAYLLRWKLAQDSLKQGVDSVLIDSTCNYPEVLEQGCSLATQHGYLYWYVESKTGDIDLLDRRMRAHQPMANQRSAVDCPPVAAQGAGARLGEDPRALLARWIERPRRPDNGSCVIIVDSTVCPEMLCRQIFNKLAHGCSARQAELRQMQEGSCNAGTERSFCHRLWAMKPSSLETLIEVLKSYKSW